ncbi:YsnF/AvaK domain-containing protein [Geminicoccus roseus]|uniref:YsnF/AvaK domain-containing protein n=1 Tax=Geminicoccus roseus TaxID=404900 RepID=UPI000402B4D8|nr:YsnF/AvaK domain-containing protein [Geminicoccus roseus]
MSKTTTTPQELKVELFEEHAQVTKRMVELGRVLVETTVETRQQVVEALLRHDEVGVQRVLIDQPVETMPQIREEDGVLIVPVVEERLVVHTQLVLKEELRITKTTGEQLVRQTVPLRSEHATVTRLEASSPADPSESEAS